MKTLIRLLLLGTSTVQHHASSGQICFTSSPQVVTSSVAKDFIQQAAAQSGVAMPIIVNATSESSLLLPTHSYTTEQSELLFYVQSTGGTNFHTKYNMVSLGLAISVIIYLTLDYLNT